MRGGIGIERWKGENGGKHAEKADQDAQFYFVSDCFFFCQFCIRLVRKEEIDRSLSATQRIRLDHWTIG